MTVRMAGSNFTPPNFRGNAQPVAASASKGPESSLPRLFTWPDEIQAPATCDAK